jgi:RNA polymerase sigma factor (sigma-70 family)
MNVTEQYTDKEVVDRVLAGEIALFEILIRRNNPFLYKTGRSYNYNHQDTQDLMQDTFIDAYTGLSTFKHMSSFKTWIIKIMLHNCFKKKQKSAYKNEHAADHTDKSFPMSTASFPKQTSHTILNRELNTVIENAIKDIPEEYRMVFLMREINGLSVKETSELLNLSESNIKVRLNRAKNMLRSEIEKSYRREETFEFNLVYCDAMVSKVMQKIKEIHAASSYTP